MLQTQVDWWKLVEQKRHNLVDEQINRRNAESNSITAAANRQNASTNIRNADTNVENARINALNASANLQNAESNARQASAAESQAESARLNVDINRINAESNARNAASNARNAESNSITAQTKAKEVEFNTLPGSPSSMSLSEKYAHAGGLKTAADAELSVAKTSEATARADYYDASTKDVLTQIEPKKLKTQTEAARNIVESVKTGVVTLGEIPRIVTDWKLLATSVE